MSYHSRAFGEATSDATAAASSPPDSDAARENVSGARRAHFSAP